MAAIRLEGLAKTFPGGSVALQGLDLAVADGELVVLVGPSGCGKSTLLRIVAGLETPSAGRVWLDGEDATGLSPQARDLAMVFQSYALYPHKSVRENLAFGLRMRGVPRAEIERRVDAAAGVLGLDALLERRPAQLSGGQRQRVALGRAIVREPRAFLLDEPLSNLDARLRVEMRAELARLHRRLAATMLHVTHDQEEALTLGDRIAVLREGRLEQVGTPLEVYRRPASAFVAGFIGSPSMNFLRGVRVAGGVEGAGWSCALDTTAAPVVAGRPVLLGVRPQDVVQAAPAEATARVRVDVVQLLGSQQLVHARTGPEGAGEAVALLVGTEVRLEPEQGIAVRFPPEAVHLFDPESGVRLA